MPPGRSRWRWLLPALSGALVVAWIAAWLIGSSVARRIAIAEAEQRLDARVEIGTLHYLPPFWVVVRDVAVSSEIGGERVDWVRIGSLYARIETLPPFGDLRLGRVTVEEPVLTLVRTPDGLRDVLDLWRGEDPEETARPPFGAARVDGARLVVVDRSGAEPARPTVTVGGFAVALDAAASPGSFTLALSGGDRHLSVQGEGTLDLPARTLALARLDAQASLDVAPSAAGDSATPAAELRGMSVTVDLATRTARVQGGTVAAGAEPQLLLEDVHATITLGDERIDASGLDVRVGGGEARGKLAVRWDEQPGWQASGEVTGVDLAAIARRFPALGGGKVAGRLTGSGSFTGALATDLDGQLASLRGSGRMRVREGEFYRLPLVAMLLEQAHLSSEGVTLRNAAAVFRIADRTIQLDSAAIGSDSIGVQGNGEVGFDGALRLDMVVMPLGDWRGHLERTGVPVIGGALAALAGKAQELLGKASAALYEFHVSGTMEAPRLTPVPVPVLTRHAAGVFGRMVDGAWDDLLRE